MQQQQRATAAAGPSHLFDRPRHFRERKVPVGILRVVVVRRTRFVEDTQRAPKDFDALGRIVEASASMQGRKHSLLRAQPQRQRELARGERLR